MNAQPAQETEPRSTDGAHGRHPKFSGRGTGPWSDKKWRPGVSEKQTVAVSRRKVNGYSDVSLTSVPRYTMDWRCSYD